jgi:hypothetical protein
MPRPSKPPLSFQLSFQDFVCISLPCHACYMLHIIVIRLIILIMIHDSWRNPQIPGLRIATVSYQRTNIGQ